MAVQNRVRFLLARAGHQPGDEVLMTPGAAERLAGRGVVQIVQTVDLSPPRPVPTPAEAAAPKRRGRPPKVK